MTSAPPSLSGSDGADWPAQAVPTSFDFAAVVQATPALVSVHEGPDHRFVFSNAACDAAVGHRPLVGLPLREAMPELAGQNLFERFDHVFRTGEADTQAALKLVGADAEGEGHARWYRHTLQPRRDSAGRVHGVISFADDVTDQVEAMEALKRRSAEFEFALAVAGGVGSWDWDVASDRLTVNDGFAALFGLHHVGTQGVPIASLIEAILPEDRAAVREATTRSIEKGCDYVQDYRVRNIDGEIRWVTARGRCFRDEEGKPTRFPGVVFDITRQIEERQEREFTYALLQSFLANSASYVFAKDLEGRYILANDFYLKAFGETEASLYGRTDRERFGEGEPYSVNDRRVAESGIPYEFEEAAVGADGEVIHAISMKFPLRDSSGVLFGTGSISTDITARRRAEATLASSEERRKRAMTVGQIGTFEYHPAAGRFELDDMAARLFGFDEEGPVAAQAIAAAVQAEDRGRWDEAIAGLGQPPGHAALSGEFRVASGEQAPRWIEVVGEGDPNGRDDTVIIGTVHDITERKKIDERLQYLNRELNHRVKNLFALTRGMIRMAARQEPGSADFAQRLVERLDALAAAHSLGLETEGTEPIDLAELLTAVLQPFSRSSGGRISIAGPRISIPRRMITPFTLTIYELATNAFKHGCFASSGGTLAIDWSVLDEGAAVTMLELRWTEDCGAPVATPPDSRSDGFGQRLIDASVAQMNGRRSTAWTASGLQLTLGLPVAEAGER